MILMVLTFFCSLSFRLSFLPNRSYSDNGRTILANEQESQDSLGTLWGRLYNDRAAVEDPCDVLASAVIQPDWCIQGYRHSWLFNVGSSIIIFMSLHMNVCWCCPGRLKGWHHSWSSVKYRKTWSPLKDVGDKVLRVVWSTYVCLLSL